MNIDNIKEKYTALNKELKMALATMQRNDQIFIIRESIKDLQKICPHNNGSFDFTTTDYCPYCGRRFKE